ncbi:hypothetical protein ACQEVF_57030 [Nonomuraea polychroma]|uniref:hypothetical protein n=1 Tax=Nonomuraea polychroma TaxID=46176 RepID=UPI003D8FFBDE
MKFGRVLVSHRPFSVGPRLLRCLFGLTAGSLGCALVLPGVLGVTFGGFGPLLCLPNLSIDGGTDGT